MKASINKFHGGNKQRYQTDFVGTESPLSENGVWRTSGTHGGSTWWTDPQKTGGNCFGSQTVHSGPPFDDSMACLAPPVNGSFSPLQYAQATLFRGAGVANGQETELFLLTKISSGHIDGLEFDLQNIGTKMSFTQWSGVPTSGDFTVLGGPYTNNVSTASGAVWVVECHYNAALNKYYVDALCNGLLVGSLDITGNSLLSLGGGPGHGYYRDNNGGTPGNNDQFCWSDWTGGER